MLISGKRGSCCQGDETTTVWQVDFIWRKYKSVSLADESNKGMTTSIRGHDDKPKAPWVRDRVGPGGRQADPSSNPDLNTLRLSTMRHPCSDSHVSPVAGTQSSMLYLLGSCRLRAMGILRLHLYLI